MPDACDTTDKLKARSGILLIGASVYHPGDALGEVFFRILATLAGFEADLIRMRTRESMAIAHAKGKPRGKQQKKLSDRQSRDLRQM